MFLIIVCCSSSTDSGRKRPLIVFDGSSTKTGGIKLKRADDLPVTDRLKSPPSNISLSNPIRKLSGSSPNSSLSRASAGSVRSPTGNGSLNISSSASPVQSSCMSTKLKRGASNSGVPESPVSTHNACSLMSFSYSAHYGMTPLNLIDFYE